MYNVMVDSGPCNINDTQRYTSAELVHWHCAEKHWVRQYDRDGLFHKDKMLYTKRKMPKHQK